MTWTEICMVVTASTSIMCFVLMMVMCIKIGELNNMVETLWCKVCNLQDMSNCAFNNQNDKLTDILEAVHELDDEDEDEDTCEGCCACECDLVIPDEDDEDEIAIHLITAEEYHFARSYSKNELVYYPDSDQVRYYFDDHSYLVMEDIPKHIGDGLMFFGMNVKEPNVVYVRNHILNSDFCITKNVE